MRGLIVTALLLAAGATANAQEGEDLARKVQCVSVDNANQAFLGQPQAKAKDAQKSALDACTAANGQGCKVFACRRVNAFDDLGE